MNLYLNKFYCTSRYFLIFEYTKFEEVGQKSDALAQDIIKKSRDEDISVTDSLIYAIENGEQ